mmetsp:Transcript_171035/g.548088  ORF Transcript_171035/g.548088 Transcript_171035/m.548088 type:complete len:362 (+) Transcript_171035:391-1476(+)
MEQVIRRPSEDTREGRALVPEERRRGDEPRAQAIHRDLRALLLQPPGQLQGKLDIGQLGILVGLPGIPSPAVHHGGAALASVAHLEPGEVTETRLAAWVAGRWVVHARSRDDDAGGGAQLRAHEVRKEEMAEVVGANRKLEAILGVRRLLLVLAQGQSSIACQHVYWPLHIRRPFLGEAPHRRQGRQIQLHGDGAPRPRPRARRDIGDRGLRLGEGAACDVNIAAGAQQGASRLHAYSGSRARDHHDFAFGPCQIDLGQRCQPFSRSRTWQQQLGQQGGGSGQTGRSTRRRELLLILHNVTQDPRCTSNCTSGTPLSQACTAERHAPAGCQGGGTERCVLEAGGGKPRALCCGAPGLQTRS